MDFRVPHQVTYDFDGRASVTEVARSLTAQDKLFREAVEVLQACFDELEVEHVLVTVREITQSSPLQHRLEGYIVAALSPGLIEDMPGDLLHTLFGVDVPDSYDSFVSLVLLLVSVWGAEQIVKKIKASKKGAEKAEAEAKRQELAAERRRLTKEAADRASITQDQMAEALNETLSKRPATVSKAAMDFLSPAKRHHARSVSIPAGCQIDQKAIEALPSDTDLADYQPPTEVTELTRATVTFFAHDRERPKHWAAKVAEVSPDRKPLHLAPEIEAEALFTRESVSADVLVTSVLGSDGEYIPSLYYLSHVYDDDVAERETG